MSDVSKDDRAGLGRVPRVGLAALAAAAAVAAMHWMPFAAHLELAKGWRPSFTGRLVVEASNGGSYFVDLRVGEHAPVMETAHLAGAGVCDPASIFWGECVAGNSGGQKSGGGLIRKPRAGSGPNSKDSTIQPVAALPVPVQQNVAVPTLLVTNRTPIGGDKLWRSFDTARDPVPFPHAAEIEVTVPLSHEVGEIETPPMVSQWVREMANLASENPNAHFSFGQCRMVRDENGILDGAAVLDQRVSALVAESRSHGGDGTVLLYVHGCCTDVEWSLKVLAQIVYDTKFTGLPVLFSWPSGTTVATYRSDETAAQDSVEDLKRLLVALASNANVRRIVLVAHSMGSRIAIDALGDLIEGEGRIARVGDKARDVVLAAPDVAADAFKVRLARRLTDNGVRITLYASGEDTALLVSQAINGGPRLGQTGDDLVIVKGVETIDATGHIGGYDGHAMLSSDSVIRDFHELMTHGTRAEGRVMLQGENHKSVGGRYWRLRRDGRE